jgi:hypothetical protein
VMLCAPVVSILSWFCVQGYHGDGFGQCMFVMKKQALPSLVFQSLSFDITPYHIQTTTSTDSSENSVSTDTGSTDTDSANVGSTNVGSTFAFFLLLRDARWEELDPPSCMHRTI